MNVFLSNKKHLNLIKNAVNRYCYTSIQLCIIISCTPLFQIVISTSNLKMGFETKKFLAFSRTFRLLHVDTAFPDCYSYQQRTVHFLFLF